MCAMLITVTLKHRGVKLTHNLNYIVFKQTAITFYSIKYKKKKKNEIKTES